MTFNTSNMSTEGSTDKTESEDTQDTNAADGTTDGESNTGENTGDNASEKSAEENTKTLTGDEKKEIILDSFQNRLDSGALKMEDLETLQPWAAEALKTRQEAKSDPSIQDVAKKAAEEATERIITENRKAEEVKNLTDRIIQAQPTQAQWKEFNKEKDLLKETMGEAEAIKLAARLVKIPMKAEAQRREAMYVPSGGDPVKEVDNSPQNILDNQADYTDQQLMDAAAAKAKLSLQ